MWEVYLGFFSRFYARSLAFVWVEDLTACDVFYILFFSNLTWFLSLFFFSVIPNCQFRSKNSRLKTFTANQLDEIKDPSGLFYILPFQKVRLPLQVQCRLGNSFLLGAHVCAGLPGQLGCSEEGVGSPFWKGDV